MIEKDNESNAQSSPVDAVVKLSPLKSTRLPEKFYEKFN